ncbi:MAG: bifunctional salicylyl-CoA 5-hydroxylase/oxidoreductase [Rhodocyclaceae bacterium]|nr:bifunctional salicylyl-CoA 5-hydroxylase/oxidoreductase [Rhodocyclaceae bacterium]
MKIACIGGGPAGLYAAILLKQTDPARRVTVFERNRADESGGWGVVFSDRTLDALQRADAESHRAIFDALHRWEDIEIHFRGETIRCGGHGFSGIARARLLSILQGRAREVGVELRFGTETHAESSAYDLIVAADGARSGIRESAREYFRPQERNGSTRYLWLGSDRRLDAFTFAFRETEWGWFNLHAYRYDAGHSTFIVEAPEAVWRAAGLDRADTAESIAFCEHLFAAQLDGARLQGGAPRRNGEDWLRFNHILCERWHHNNLVLLGDAAHAVHFSVGSGTKLAMEDAAALADCLRGSDAIPLALAAYQARREPEVRRLQSAARNRQEWFENVARYTTLDPLQFSYSLLTSSQRIGHGNLRQRDADYVGKVERWFAARNAAADTPPPMFAPFRLRSLTLQNRVVVAPMAMYRCREGVPGDFHFTHFAARALGGAGLVMTEMTCVAPDARITPDCAGLWNEAQMLAWKRIVNWTHAESVARIGLQLGHAGPKGSTCPPWEGEDIALESGNWPLLAASAQPYRTGGQMPRAMTRTDMDAVKAAFIAAAERAVKAGFDLLELHCAHGYLLSSFLCPLSNRRDDAYGGVLRNRLRYPLEVFAALRAAWPAERPMAVRISAHDWAPGGNTADDAVAIARAFKAAGADLIDVSSGQTTVDAHPVYGRMYQTPFADRIRNEAGIATVAVGNITEADQINTIVAAGRADLCALGRPHLGDPMWTLRAAAAQGYADAVWPLSYLPGRDQLARLAERAATGESAA